MMRYLKILFLSLAIIGLMSGSAFAAASLNAGNTTLAAEQISPAVAYVAGAVNTAYTPAGAVANTTVVRISLGNGTFTAASTMDICDPTGTTVSAVSGVVGALTTGYVDVTVTTPLSPGEVYTFQDDICVGLFTPLSNINVVAGSPAGTTVTMTVANKANAADTNLLATGTVLNVVNQFSATLGKVTSKLDFTDNMETYIVAGTALPYTPTNLRSDASIYLMSDQSINDKVIAVVVGPCTNTLAVGDSVVFKVTGNLTGIANIKQGAVAGPASIYIVNATDRTNGYATLSIGGAALTTALCLSTDVLTKGALELTAANTAGTPIVAGIRTADVTLTGGGLIPAGYTRALLSGVAAFDIQLDASQFYIPLVKVTTGAETYIKLQSKSAVAGANGISVQILAFGGSMVTYSAGNITSGTPVTITGTQLKDAVVAAGKTVDGAAGFAAIVTVNTPNADVFAYANTCDLTGCKRIPVKTAYIAGAAQIVE